MELKNKTALITGSTSGIGLAIAKNFASKGANIVLNGFGDTKGLRLFAKSLLKTSVLNVITQTPICLSQSKLERW